MSAVTSVGTSVRSWRVSANASFPLSLTSPPTLPLQPVCSARTYRTVSPEEASLAYTDASGIAALRQARTEVAANVVVVGLGVIGLCTVALARAMGARVVGVANSSIRTEMALRLGAHGALYSDEPSLKEQLADTLATLEPRSLYCSTKIAGASYRLSMEIVANRGRVSLTVLRAGSNGTRFQSARPEGIGIMQNSLTVLRGTGYIPRTDCQPSDLRFNIRRNLEYILSFNGRWQYTSCPGHHSSSASVPNARSLRAGQTTFQGTDCCCL